MMRSAGLALVFILASASAAQAGAWLREQGKGFASASVQTKDDDNTETSIYLEYGLAPWVTAGADITYDTDLTRYIYDQSTVILNDDGSFPQGSGILFLRFPLGPRDRTNKFAFHVGYGGRYVNGTLVAAQEVGVSWGRGIKLGERYGWVNVDTSFNTAEDPARDRTKLDGTLGLGFTERTRGMIQMFNTFEAGETFSKIAPSILVALGRDKNTTLQIGSEIPVSGGGSATIKVGFWYEF